MKMGIRIVLGLALAGGLSACKRETPAPPPKQPDLNQQVLALEEEAFPDEKEARRFENQGIVPFWDRLLTAPAAQRLAILGETPFDQLTLGRASEPIERDLRILTRTLSEGGEIVNPAGLRAHLDTFRMAGYTLDHSDWHHASFERGPDGIATSTIRFNLQGTRNQGSDRLAFSGLLEVRWDDSGDTPRPALLRLLEGRSAQRRGPPGFTERARIFGKSSSPDRDDTGALSVFDLDGDQLPEIILGNANRVFWNQGGGNFKPGMLTLDNVFVRSVTGLMADLTGDGIPDWIGDTPEGHLSLLPGVKGGFSSSPRHIKLEAHPLVVPSFVTAGDIDRDGDLDLFVGQWRNLYDKMPDAFWDANDGHGNTLLLNDGTGRFTDATAAAGLAPKRFRRSYSGSFLDLDRDGDLDLMVVSDFRGIDLFLNDGAGHFADATDDLIDNPHSFGMSHTVADYDGDGRSDLYVMGMGSTTARRLDRMGARPEGFEEHNRMRGIMGFGNRMYLSRDGGTFESPAFLDRVARTGWTWGVTSADFDNDGDADVYAANGHISGKTTRDYCSNFWCRDIYVMQGSKRAAIATYLDGLPMIRTQSWDGYQVNPLLLNGPDGDFRDAAFLLGVGFTEDSRRVVSADLDLDGRMDLVVGHMEGTSGFFHDGSQAEPPTLLVLLNTLPEAAARPWIGVTLSGRAGVSPLGARVEIETSLKTREFHVISGDSFMCQHPGQVHTGLETGEEVRRIRVNWPDGSVTSLPSPKTGMWHMVRSTGSDQNLRSRADTPNSDTPSRQP